MVLFTGITVILIFQLVGTKQTNDGPEQGSVVEARKVDLR